MHPVDSNRAISAGSGFQDPIRDGLARGWRVHGGPHAPAPAQWHCDVAIIGTGAGGGIAAEVLSQAGLSVAMVEEGPLHSSADFHQLESEAYPFLYQESAARKTADKAITLLQGRCVGGSTTVNWTSSFRTPPDTLSHWRSHFGLDELSEAALQPWFERVERRLNISDWPAPPNENNALMLRGAQRLGLPVGAIRRNVKGCWDLGSCGMGCPTNAKQSMLITTVPAALQAGAVLWVQTRAERLIWRERAVQGVECRAMGADGQPMGPPLQLWARHVVVAGGAINSPALLMRSDVPDPYGRLGQRTFLHPVVLSAAVLDQAVQGWQGAPQTVYSDHYLKTQPLDGPIGFKLEAPPLHPLIFAATMAGFGGSQTALLRQFPHTQVLLALLRDGFHPDSPGGQVGLRTDGTPELDYPLTPFVMEGARRALLAMAEWQFAAGARLVVPVHELAVPQTRWAQARESISALPMEPLQLRVVSAHVMGGCGMAGDAAQGVTRPDGAHWQLANLSVLDGSLFPTSVGANPQLSIYALVARLASGLAQRLQNRTAVRKEAGT